MPNVERLGLLTTPPSSRQSPRQTTHRGPLTVLDGLAAGDLIRRAMRRAKSYWLQGDEQGGLMGGPSPDGDTDDIAHRAEDALHRPRVPLDDALPELPDRPGLYAIHGPRAVWVELGLGAPPDGRPLYVGKSESSLHHRDVSTHFNSGRTGSSTVRRSFAALLADSLDLRGVPRNPDEPSRFANYGLNSEHDDVLTRWMRSNLTLAVWERDVAISLDAVETRVLDRLVPPLNISKVTTPWRRHVRESRRQMADEARQWARDRGLDE